jgi:hypothetical protein
MARCNLIWEVTMRAAATGPQTRIREGFRRILCCLRKDGRLPSLKTYRRIVDAFYQISLWICLPLAIWLSSGWFGVLIHLQSNTAPVYRLAGKLTRPQRGLYGASISQ